MDKQRNKRFLQKVKADLSAFKKVSGSWPKPMITTDKKKKANKNECRKWKM
jgi:hypothetical protein